MLERKAYEQLVFWKTHKGKQALLVTGARQIGKTYLIREFGARNYENVVEINLLENVDAREAFETARNTADLFMRISLVADAELVAGKTLIFIDEVQECKEMVTAIKFLVERTDYDYVLSGSLLGVELADIRSVPVGYLDTVEMYPLDFEEFCWANKIPMSLFANELAKAFEQFTEVDPFVHERLLSLFHQYLIVGGMPAAVQEFVEEPNMQVVRSIQDNIVRQYKRDISKYNKTDPLGVREVYDLIPSELNAKNKRFVLKSLNENARFNAYAHDFVWLAEANVALPTYCVEEPVYPLLLSKQSRLFKLFLSDVGLLTSRFMKDISLDILAKDPQVNYGSIYENVVAQELKAGGFELFYFNSKKYGELDFVVETRGGQILPIEVKSGKTYKRHRALTSILDVPNYYLNRGYVLCEANVSVEKNIVYLPIYLAGLFRTMR